jgi:hypothetical protein
MVMVYSNSAVGSEVEATTHGIASELPRVHLKRGDPLGRSGRAAYLVLVYTIELALQEMAFSLAGD